MLRLPPSCTSFGLNTLTLVPVLGALAYLRHHDHGSTRDMLILLGVVSASVVFIDVAVLRVYRRSSTGLAGDRTDSPDVLRVLTKLLGLALTLGLIAGTYWIFPEYHGSFYDPLWSVLRAYALPLALLSATYFWFLDGKMRAPRDAYWQLGRVCLLQFSDARRADLGNHFLGWLVKAYFFPLMFVWLHNSVHELISFDLAGANWSNLRFYDYLVPLIYGLDLLYTTAGYALSLRIIDTHIRTAEPTVYGWIVALFCYQPFFSLFEGQYIAYGGNVSFGSALADLPYLRWAYAFIILALLAIYTLATVTFGVRFSNLTHRGILTGGPYRFSKHPAYLSKNLSWWLISVPFLHTPWPLGIRHCLALGCLNMIYFLRARTEERHLSRDADYVAYALWMNDHGILSFLGRWFPLLRYKSPAQPVPKELPIAAQ
jgi:protein-S-isoprenylcysteine O-methyltransferase Ste14